MEDVGRGQTTLYRDKDQRQSTDPLFLEAHPAL